MVEAIAAGLGYTFRALWYLVRFIRAAAGPALLVLGTSMFSVGAAVIVGGLLICWLNMTPREAAK